MHKYDVFSLSLSELSLERVDDKAKHPTSTQEKKTSMPKATTPIPFSAKG